MGITILFLAVFFSLCAASETGQSRKIVVFKKSFDKRASQDLLLKNSGAIKIKSLKLINGTVVHLSPQTEHVLKNKDEVLRIDEDFIIHAAQIKAGTTGKRSRISPIECFPGTCF